MTTTRQHDRTTTRQHDSVTGVIEVDDDDSRMRMMMLGHFRWLPKVPDAPVMPINSRKISGQLKVNDIFTTKLELQDALGKYAIDNRFKWKVYKSTKSVFEVKCKHAEDEEKKCNWRAQGIVSRGTSMFRLKRLDIMDHHSCGGRRDLILPHHRQLGKRIAGIIVKAKCDVNDQLHRSKSIMFHFNKIESVDISYMQAYRARRWALEAYAGSPEESYMFLPDYCETLKSLNPGTVTHIETENDGRFKFFFMAMGASFRGFKEHIRPVLAVDGTHLKGRYRGILYTAVGHDGNGQIYPVGFGIGPNECNEAWLWFLTKLKEQIFDVEDLVVIFDGNTSIIYAVNLVFPNAIHGACAHHLQMNVKAKFSQIRKIAAIFWKVAKAYRVSKFEERFARLRELHLRDAEYLEQVEKQKWSRAFFCGRRYNLMTTNHAESINAVLGKARDLPIIQLVEFMRALLQKWYYERRTKAEERETHLCEWAENLMQCHVLKAIQCSWHPVNNHTFEVRDKNKGGVVDLNAKTCTCRKWQLARFPCKHVCKVASEFRMDNAYRWVSRYYTNETLNNAWKESIYPLPHQSEWKVCDPPIKVLPPSLVKRPTGRPPSQKRRPS